MKNQPRHSHRPFPAHPHIEATPLHEAVTAHAHELWRRHGHPANRDEAIWLEAALFIFVLTPLLHSLHP